MCAEYLHGLATTVPPGFVGGLTVMHRLPAGGLSWGARVLLFFCRAPGTPDYPTVEVHYEPGKELERLDEVFPGFSDKVRGKVVIDFGCGEGYQAVAIARAGASRVIGVEINERLLELARKRAASLRLEGTVGFERRLPDTLKADFIVSQNSFEHFLNPRETLDQMLQALTPGGKLYITFGPPWYAPWGAHMSFFCRLPWVQLLFRQRTVMEARLLFRSDNARTYRETGLAQMSVAKFEGLIAASGLTIEFRRYDCVHKMNWLQWTPMRELFVNRVSCVLTHGYISFRCT